MSNDETALGARLQPMLPRPIA